MKRLGSTRAAALLGITGGAAVLAAILRWVQLSNDIKSNGAVLPGRYLYLVIAVLSVAVLAALAVLIRPLRRQTRWEEIFSGGKLPNILHIASAVCFVIGGVMLYYASLPKTEDEAPRPYAAAEDDKPAHPAARRRVRGHACCLCTQVPAAREALSAAVYDREHLSGRAPHREFSEVEH